MTPQEELQLKARARLRVKQAGASKPTPSKLAKAKGAASAPERGNILDPLVGQGILMGFGDEAKAGVRAGARWLFDNPGEAPQTRATDVLADQLGVPRPQHPGEYRSIGDLYDEELADTRGDLEAYRERHPTESTLAEIGGAVATIPFLPGGVAAKGAGWAERLLRSGGAGALYGGGYGFGSGEGVEDRMAGGLGGALVGGAFGAAAPLVTEGLVQGGRLLKQLNPVRGLVNREGQASQRVARALSEDAGGPQNVPGRLASVERARQQGFPAVTADAGGEATRALARSAANNSPAARQQLQEVTQNRFEQQGDRTAQFIRSLVGNTDTVATQDALRDAAQRHNRPAYDRAYRDGDRGLWSPTLERLTSSPAVVDAMRNAGARGQNRAVAEGMGGFNAGVTIDPSGIVQFQRGPRGVPTYPNLQYWDVVRRELSDATNAARRAGRNEEAGSLGTLSRQLNQELDRLVPSYQAARQGAAQFFGAQDSLEAGQRFVMANLNNGDARRAITRMSDPERELFAEGFASELINKIRGLRDRSNVVTSIFVNTGNARDRIRIALGPQRARQLEAFLRVEGMLDELRTAVSGNSTTARQLLESGLAGGASGGLAFVGPDATQGNYSMSAAIALGAAGVRYGVNRDIAARVGRMLASDDPKQFLKGLDIIAKNEKLMDFVRSFHSALTRGATPSGSQPLRVYLSAGERDEAYANEKKGQPANQERGR